MHICFEDDGDDVMNHHETVREHNDVMVRGILTAATTSGTSSGDQFVQLLSLNGFESGSQVESIFEDAATDDDVTADLVAEVLSELDEQKVAISATKFNDFRRMCDVCDELHMDLMTSQMAKMTESLRLVDGVAEELVFALLNLS